MDDEFISLHRADGMIVCSPTGSTAYALSGGGPLLHPALEAIALVPICPHTLSDRPIVISGDQTVRLVVRGDERSQAMVTFDGQTSETLQPGDSIEIRRDDSRLRLIHPAGYSYYGILRNKLRWGRGQENLAERA
jgi:NAD+ kinase